MAVLKETNWYMRAGGSDTNGGGYDGENYAGGVNYADQDSPQATLTTSSTVHSTTTQINVAVGDYTVTANDVGNCILITSGTATQGYYFITTVDIPNNRWTMDRSVGASSATVAGKMGGAHASFKQYMTGGAAGTPSITSPLIAGNTINVRGSGTDNGTTADFDYTANGANYWTATSGSSTNGWIKIVGYNGRPVIKHPGLLIYSVSGWWCENIKFINTGANYSIGVINYTVMSKNCIYDQAGYDNTVCATISAMDNYFLNTGSTSSGSTYSITPGSYGGDISGNFFLGTRGPAISVNNIAKFTNNLIVNNKSSVAAVVVTNTNTSWTTTIVGNTIYNSAGDGIRATTAAGITGSVIYNNIIANNTGYGINFTTGTASFNNRNVQILDYNNIYSNTAGAYNGCSAGSHDTALNPSFTNTGTYDFSVGTNMKAIGYPSLIGRYSATTSYVDAGVAQRQESGGGGSATVAYVSVG